MIRETIWKSTFSYPWDKVAVLQDPPPPSRLKEKPLRFTKGQALLLYPPSLFFASSSPRLTCYAVKGSVATLPAYAPLTAQVGEALGRYEDGSGGQAKREKRRGKQGIP